MPKLQILGLAQLIYRAPLRDNFSFMIIRFCLSYKANSKSLFSLNILYSKSLFSLKILYYWGHYLKGQNDLFLTVRKPIRSCGRHVAKILEVYDDSQRYSGSRWHTWYAFYFQNFTKKVVQSDHIIYPVFSCLLLVFGLGKLISDLVWYF